MSVRRFILFCLIALLPFTNISYAAFPVRTVVHTSATATDAPAAVPAQPAVVSHHSPILQKAKSMMPFRDRWGNRKHSDKCGLSIISFCLMIAAYGALFSILLIPEITAGLAFGLLIGAEALGLSAFITGIIALGNGQRYRLLAALAVYGGSGFVAALITFLILLAFLL